MAKNTKIEKIKLVYKEAEGSEKSFYYTTRINKANMEGKLKLKKYHRGLRKHVVFEQEKIK